MTFFPSVQLVVKYLYTIENDIVNMFFSGISPRLRFGCHSRRPLLSQSVPSVFRPSLRFLIFFQFATIRTAGLCQEVLSDGTAVVGSKGELSVAIIVSKTGPAFRPPGPWLDP